MTRRVAWGSALAAFYLALALAATWPLPSQMDGVLSQGTDRAVTVPLFQAWTLWWTSDRLAEGFAGLWHAPIFHPTRGAFVFSDPMLLEGVLSAPAIWLGASPALAYNLLLIVALVTNGLFGFALLRSAKTPPAAAAAGGAMLVLLPYVHHEIGVLMLVPLAGLLGTLWAWLCFVRAPSGSAGLALGLATAASYLLCGQYGVFVALVLAPSGLWLVRRPLVQRKTLLGLLAAGAVFVVLVAPLVTTQIAAMQELGFQRNQSAALRSASYPSAWAATPWPQLVPLPGVEPVDERWKQAHFPGTLKFLLALLGIAWGLRRPERRRWTALLLTATLLASLLSALPRLELGELSFYRALRDVVPGLAQMRSYWRFIVVAQIGVVLLAAQGLHAGIELGRPRLPGTWRRAAVPACVALGLLAAVELWPRGQVLRPAPDLEQWKPWTSWMRDHLAAEEAVVHLPFPASIDVADFEDTAAWMYLMSAHGRPMANGYSGFFPRSYNALARALRGCPGPESYSLIRTLGYGTLVIESSWLTDHPDCAPPGHEWERRVTFEALDVEVWRSSALRSVG